jgi:hypothetical protein
MKRKARRERFWAWGLVLAGCGLGTGCSLPLYSPHGVPDDLAQACGCIAQGSRKHVYVFFVQGADPFDWANLEGVKEYVQSLGFPECWFGFYWHVGHFKKEILRIHQEDPDACIALVGFSCGATFVRDLAYAVGEQGVFIDLMVYLDGTYLKNTCKDRPDNVGKLLNLPSNGHVLGGPNLDAAENYGLPESWHYATPTRPGTLDVLVRELARLAGSIPAVDDTPARPLARDEPTPHPVRARPDTQPDEWDFLKPESVERRQPLPTTVLPPETPFRQDTNDRHAGR